MKSGCQELILGIVAPTQLFRFLDRTTVSRREEHDDGENPGSTGRASGLPGKYGRAVHDRRRRLRWRVLAGRTRHLGSGHWPRRSIGIRARMNSARIREVLRRAGQAWRLHQARSGHAGCTRRAIRSRSRSEEYSAPGSAVRSEISRRSGVDPECSLTNALGAPPPSALGPQALLHLTN